MYAKANVLSILLISFFYDFVCFLYYFSLKYLFTCKLIYFVNKFFFIFSPFDSFYLVSFFSLLN